MDSTIILVLLAISSVLSIGLSVVKGVLDQLPDVFESWGTARRAWRRANEDDRAPAAEREPSSPDAGAISSEP
ncbi:hypothetical protein VM98_03150 [Streptomyces rubellomurinus subsp. indigoferus]|nr:hypothetical protein VM98_03150 [Streptomyces rubellomurinus subsp. indigoferus]